MNRCCPGRSQLYEPFGLAALLKANLYETTPGEQYLERGDWVRHDRDSGKEPEKVIFTLRPGDIRRYQACARRGKAPTHTLVQQGPSIVRPVQGDKKVRQ